MNSYPHMCRMDHEEIGHRDSNSERCPVCRRDDDITAAQARIEKLTAALGRFTLSCENIHHKRGEYHNSDEPCKALAAVEKAMGE